MMKDKHIKWMDEYQLFLFDFDGLLVNTEEIHYLAYKQMCANRGIDLHWSFDRYCQAAHYESDALKLQFAQEFPQLFIQEPNWDVLYAEKKHFLKQLFHKGAVQMMPGAENLLKLLHSRNIPHCVVTHSADDLVQLIRQQNPILDTIPFWITRENYSQPKPNPECYQKAIAKLSNPGDRVIGFEDTPRGIRALLGTSAQPVLICQTPYPEIPMFLQQGVKHYRSLL